MENLSRSLSKKVCNGNGNGFTAKTVYDDVFGRPPKFGVPTFSPRVEDYSEIFGGFHASRPSSIPLLDLPAVDEAEVSFDVRSSKFDYWEVFGGFNGLDFAVSYDELFDESKGGDESSEEAWTPAETEFLSEETDPFPYSGKNQSLSNGDCHQSFDGIKQFNVSYHKANQRSQEYMSNGTHLTQQLHDVPGFTFAVDEITPLQETEYENPPLQVTDDINLSMDFRGGKIGGKHLRKTMSHPANTCAGTHAFGKDLKPQRGYGQNGTHPNEMFVTVSEIGLRTRPSQLPPPSRPPPALDVRKGDSSGLASNLKATRNCAFEGTAGDSSPPFFDVEVDASSSAAASAAAMKEVMEKAQAKLKSAKELMDRKKEGLQIRMKLGSKNDIKDKEAKVSKVVDGSNNSKDERVQGPCEREDNGMKFFDREEGQRIMKTTQVVSDSVEGEENFIVAKKYAEKKHGKGSLSSQESYKTEGAGEWKEETEFFELVRTDKFRKVLQPVNNEKILVQNTKTQERSLKERKAAVEAFEQQEENDKKMKAGREAREEEENEKKSKAAKDACRQEHEKKVNVAQEVCKQEESEKKLRVVCGHEETEKKLTEADEWEEDEILIEVQQKENAVQVKEAMKDANERMESEERFNEARESEENEKRLKETFEQEEYEKILKEVLEQVENEKRLKQVLEKEENEKRLKEVLEREEVKKKQKEACEREENEKRPKEALEREENRKRLKEALEWEENEKKQKAAREREENEKKLREAFEREENEKKLKQALEKEENEKKQKAAREREENEKRLREAHEREEVEKRLKEAHEREENVKRIIEVIEWEEIAETSSQDSMREESENRFKDAGEGEQREWHKAHEDTIRDENEKEQKLAQGNRVHIEGENLKAPVEVCELNENKNLRATQVACKHEENSVKLEATQEALADEENEKIRTGPKDNENEVEAVEKANVLVGDRFKASGMAQGDLQHEEFQITLEDAINLLLLDENVKKSGEAVIGIIQTCIEKNIKVPQMASDPKTMEKTLTHELGERGKKPKQVQVAFDQEKHKHKFMSTQVVNERVGNGRKVEAAQLASLEGKRNTLKTAQQVNTSQGKERKEKNLNETLTLEEKEKEEKMRREIELEKDCLRKLEEEREREREREKDRMAVERATRETREGAYAEARERAERAAVERATAEARQRALTEARERLEKACAEAREKSLTEKASMDARLRAERAAVERATAEARERAFEKAMAEKPALEARERVERSASSSGSRFPYSLVYSASYNTEKFEGVEGESAQRCKARLERYRRTAERAAKALAEKNMRDLQAQREQAERNRLAESLDADVKRWSSGKEGNLRALLSTLQYILGPDSGWQPIPLTDVITAAAVKKAYRKATLCVHPDKLQQRGASIQQKYICEKVFDLLKGSNYTHLHLNGSKDKDILTLHCNCTGLYLLRPILDD